MRVTVVALFRTNPYAYAGREMSSAREHLFDLCHEYPGWAEAPRDARANEAADILRLAETSEHASTA